MMLTPCWPSAGPTGGAGVPAPALICSLTTADSRLFFGGIPTASSRSFSEHRARPDRGPVSPPAPWIERRGTLWCSRSDLRDLVEPELDRGLAAEDGDQDLDLLGVDVDLGDARRERRERPVHDGDRLADLEVDLDRRRGTAPRLRGRGPGIATLGLLRRLLPREQELRDLVEGQGRGPRRRPDEAGDAGRVAHRAPRGVVEVHPHEDIAGQHLALDLLALPVLDLGDLLGGHLDLEDEVLDVE